MAKEFYKARALSCFSKPENYTWSNIIEDLKELSKIWTDLPPDIKHFFEEDVEKLESKLNTAAILVFLEQSKTFFLIKKSEKG